jgi:membrane protein
MTTQTHTDANGGSDWTGEKMLDRAGEPVGTIDEIFLVEETGRPEWALVKRGRIRSKATLVPLKGASPTNDGVRAAYAKDVIEEAPALDDAGDPSDEQVTAIYRHYGIALDDAQAQPPAEQPARAHERPATISHARQRDGNHGSGHAAGLVPTLKRTVKEFSDDNLTHWAAALTYYGVLSIFPALLALVSILGLFGGSAIDPLMDNLKAVAPGPAQEILTNALNGLKSGGGAGPLFVISLAAALWSASGYISGFMDASNAIYDVEEGRSLVKKLPLRLGITLLMLVLLSASAFAVVLTGPVAEQAGSLFGVGDSALAVWDIAKWPVLVLLVAFMFAVLYYAAPNVKQPGLKAVLPGGVVAVVLWIAVSVLFAFYVASFASYNKTYGALGGVIVFLVWLWLTNIAILLGAEFNAERARGRYMDKGHRADDEPYLPPRAAPPTS